MAKVELLGPLASMSGMISKESEVYFRTCRGKTYLCKRPVPTVKVKGQKNKLTSAQQSHQEVFRQAMAMTQDIMKSANLRRVYETQWRRQKKYLTLRGFVSAKMMAMLKGGGV